MRPRLRRASAHGRARLGACLVAALAFLLPALARAHHVPGHGVSEGIRNLNSLGGGTGKALNRVALLGEVTSNSTTLNPGTAYVTSLIGEYSPHPWTSFGAQLPYAVIDQRSPGAPTVHGYGDTRVFVRLTPHADKLVHRVLTTVVNVSFPTRRYELTAADPGPLWVVAPALVYSRTHPRAFWQLLAVGAYEHRPAGTSIDLSGGGQVGARLLDSKLSPAIGMLADVRAATFCTEVGGGSRFCREGRATEIERPVGALRVTSLAGLTYAFAPWGLVSANIQLPLLTKRDFDIAGSLTFQAMF